MADAPIKVLLVDDDEEDYMIARDLFEEIAGGNYVVEWKQNFADGLAEISRRAHDVYLLDYRLGERNGLELLREALKSGCTKPVILLTGQGDHEIDVESMRAGASDYLTKGQISSSMLERSVRYAIERSRAMEMLRELSTIDELTGLYNRREMSRILNEAVQRCRRHQRPTALVMLDIDHFKSVNDTYGHQIGDEVIRWIVRVLRAKTRTSDHLARFGGEELAVILPEATSDEALLLANRLCRGVAERPFEFITPEGTALKFAVTVSLGVASMPDDARTEDSLIAAADAALYEAKRTGRNKVALYSHTTIAERPVPSLVPTGAVLARQTAID